ncbi:28S ribosomal protein S9, mitochondrial [Vespa velutina]|uniref:28S ribosomal protein S9, mitochondrial n=1 Tax=Vespa velutina TaxID=202808 RepID=UPI001FB28C7D|nr:28S ribosomal protein S9, mitochondrial [Vespa velutina]
MATPMFVRLSNFRNLLRINNNVPVITSNPIQCLKSIYRLSSTQEPSSMTNEVELTSFSKIMQGYLKRIKANEELMKVEIEAYEKGKRHLANMMGEDPENFTQNDIDKSIEYLFPSGLYDSKARPMMKHPKDILLLQKTGQFLSDGKPCHSFFYTLYPSYYETLHNLEDLEDKLIKSTGTFPNENKFDIYGSMWKSKVQLEKLLHERLMDHHVSYNEDGKPYVKVFPCQRKSSIATVIVWGKGTGKITINGKDISYFQDMQSRQQREDDDNTTAQLYSIERYKIINANSKFSNRDRPSDYIAYESNFKIKIFDRNSLTY